MDFLLVCSGLCVSRTLSLLRRDLSVSPSGTQGVSISAPGFSVKTGTRHSDPQVPAPLRLLSSPEASGREQLSPPACRCTNPRAWKALFSPLCLSSRHAGRGQAARLTCWSQGLLKPPCLGAALATLLSRCSSPTPTTRDTSTENPGRWFRRESLALRPSFVLFCNLLVF